MNLMPKISSKIEQSIVLKEYIDKYEKTEIQFFQEVEGDVSINFVKTIEQYVNVFNLKEITIHPPLMDHDIEYLLLRDKEYLKRTIKEIIELSRSLNIKINLLLHTHWGYERLKFGVAPYFKEALKLIENENVLILIENLPSTEDRKSCAVLDFCDLINHPKLKVCIDVCHLHCKANMLKKDINEYLTYYLDKEKCEKHVYQIHFSYVSNNDGYVDKSTHGIVHPNKDELLKDIEILKEYGMNNKMIVTEIGEKDYSVRKDQIQELKWLEEVL